MSQSNEQWVLARFLGTGAQAEELRAQIEKFYQEKRVPEGERSVVLDQMILDESSDVTEPVLANKKLTRGPVPSYRHEQ